MPAQASWLSRATDTAGLLCSGKKKKTFINIHHPVSSALYQALLRGERLAGS